MKHHKHISSTGMQFYYWGKMYVRIQKVDEACLSLSDYAVIETEGSIYTQAEFDTLKESNSLISITASEFNNAIGEAWEIIDNMYAVKSKAINPQ